LLIIATIAMLLISIHPFAFRKIFLLAAALLSLSSALCFADPLFMTRHYPRKGDQTRSASAPTGSARERVKLLSHSKSFGDPVAFFEDGYPTVSLPLAWETNGATIFVVSVARIPTSSEISLSWDSRVAELDTVTPAMTSVPSAF